MSALSTGSGPMSDSSARRKRKPAPITDEPARTDDRVRRSLHAALTARRTLLGNLASGGDEARRRFASHLHDDTLQLLTAAELQLERIRAGANDPEHAARLDEL